MNILNRTQGIDLRAKSGVLMGMAEVILKDVDTGKVKEVVKQQNMFTNALNSLFNKSAFNMANMLNIKPIGSMNEYQNEPIQTPINEKALGGILLFPNALGSDADVLFPDFATNYPTGYASRESYTQDDSRQGVFDGVSSGEITNGYKFVYTWGSAYGNGTIASVALSNSKCYKYFNSYGTAMGGYSLVKTLGASGSWQRRSIGINSQGLWLDSGEARGGSIYLCRIPERKIDLMYDPMATTGTYEEAIPDFTYSGADTLFAVNEDYVHVFKVTSSSASSSTISYTKIDTSDFTKTTTTLTVSAYVAGASSQEYETCSVRGNYAYLPKNGWGSIYKINLTNTADITEIELPSGASTNLAIGTTLCGSNIYGYNFIIGTDDEVRVTSDNNNGYFPCYLDGVWCGKAYLGNTNSHSLRVDVITPYCATHADLQNAVQKDASKQMVVNYSVLQV